MNKPLSPTSKDILVVFLISISMISIGNYMMVSSHESLHKAIYANYNITSEIKEKPDILFSSGITNATEGLKNVSLTPEEIRNINVLNNFVEIVNYQFITMFVIFSLFFMTIMILIAVKE